jgi:hypothetical protein
LRSSPHSLSSFHELHPFRRCTARDTAKFGWIDTSLSTWSRFNRPDVDDHLVRLRRFPATTYGIGCQRRRQAPRNGIPSSRSGGILQSQTAWLPRLYLSVWPIYTGNGTIPAA